MSHPSKLAALLRADLAAAAADMTADEHNRRLNDINGDEYFACKFEEWENDDE